MTTTKLYSCSMPHPRGQATGPITKTIGSTIFRHRICDVCGGSQGIARIPARFYGVNG